MSFEQQYYEADEFWADGMLTNSGNSKRIEETIALVPDDVRSVLDVGCGNGVFANSLAAARSSIEVTATDRSQAALQFVNTSKFESDITSLPAPDRSFDCVTCLQVIEHLPHHTYELALAQLARVARKYIIIGVPYQENLLRDFTQCPHCKSAFNLNLHFRSYDTQAIRSLFSPAGFRCIEDRNIAPTRELYGIRLYAKLRAALRSGAAKRFESPICPVCGYHNSAFQTPSTSAAHDESPGGGGVKGLLRAVWPTHLAPGYWSIALYCRA